MDVGAGGSREGLMAKEEIRKIGFRNTAAKILRMRKFVSVIVMVQREGTFTSCVINRADFVSWGM